MRMLDRGQEFAGYRILGLLGSGSTGDVYLAEHPRVRRPEALKILAAGVSAEHAAAQLVHPNIVGIHDRGRFHGQHWVTMDYIAGTDVARLVKQRYPAGLPDRQAVEIVLVVAGALDHAHRHGLVHGDVKPANVLLSHPETPAQRIVLADFGISVPSPKYPAPERLVGQPLDGRADQYALARSAQAMLTATGPAEHVLAKALATDPASRYETCTAFANELLVALRFRPPAPPPHPYGVRTPATPRRDKPKRAVVLLTVLAVALIGATLAVVFGDDDRTEHAGPSSSSSKPTSTTSTRTSTRRTSSTPSIAERAGPSATFNFDGRPREVVGDVACETYPDEVVAHFDGEGGAVIVRLAHGPDPHVRSVGLGSFDGMPWFNTSDSGRGGLAAVSVDGKTFDVTGDVYALDNRGNYIGKPFELGFTCP